MHSCLKVLNIKGGVMSEGIFNLVASSKKLTKPLNFLLLLEKLRNVDLVKFLRIPSEIIPFLKATV